MYPFQEEKLDHFLTIGASTRFGEKVPFKNLQKKVMKAGAKGKQVKIEELTYQMSTMGNDLPASFSNYGKKGVDVFAPGLEIYNSVPQSDYAAIQGTSMACPMVAGAAAFLKSYFPNLSMKEVKDILLASATVYKGESVVAPGGFTGNMTTTSDMVDFGNLSVTGGVINLYEDVELCLEKEK